MKALIFLDFQSGVWGVKMLQTCHQSTSVHKSISCPSFVLFFFVVVAIPKICFQWNMSRAVIFLAALQSVSMAALRDSLATMSRMSWLWNFSIFFTSCAWSVLYSKHCKTKFLISDLTSTAFYLVCSCYVFICAWNTLNKESIEMFSSYQEAAPTHPPCFRAQTLSVFAFKLLPNAHASHIENRETQNLSQFLLAPKSC